MKSVMAWGWCLASTGLLSGALWQSFDRKFVCIFFLSNFATQSSHLEIPCGFLLACAIFAPSIIVGHKSKILGRGGHEAAFITKLYYLMLIPFSCPRDYSLRWRQRPTIFNIWLCQNATQPKCRWTVAPRLRFANKNGLHARIWIFQNASGTMKSFVRRKSLTVV